MQPPLHSSYSRQAALSGVRCGLLVLLVTTAVYAQPSPVTFPLTTIPADGILLRANWQFQPGDDPHGASSAIDDRTWSPIDPTKDVRELPQLQRAGIGWLRLHLTTGPTLPPVMMHVFQSVASEVYLDGRLIYRFGRVSTNPDSVRAYNPVAAFNLPLRPASQHLLAVRVACQPGLELDKKYLRWDAAALQLRLFPAVTLPTIPPFSLRASYFDTLKIGISLILFILHLSLFLAYRTQRTNGYAAGMYLLLSSTFLARVANGLGHSMDLRMMLYYGSLIDVWVPCVVLFTFYSGFNFRKGWLFWLAIGSLGLRFLSLPAGYGWLSIVINYYLPFELIRLSIVAVRRGLLGARIVLIGAFCNLGLWLNSEVLSALHITAGDHEWLYHALYLVSFLCFPLTLSLRLALEHGWINRQLLARLQEVEQLSARNLVQQRERQQLLSRQNEHLEQQVAERTYELHQQADQLRELDGVKSRFVTNITHEFRTPLTLILSPVERLLAEGRFDRPMLTLVQHNAGQLLQLINQLLDLSKLEGNHMTPAPVQGSVTDFIDQMVTLFLRQAEQKAVVFTCNRDLVLPGIYLFDAERWATILSNLLANALKFTDPGGHVTLTATPIMAKTQMTGLQIGLTDSGIGMAAHELPHIFDRFYQTDSSSTRGYGGTGIGLALVHELVGLLDGTVAVESELGVGTTFRLTLPVYPLSTNVNARPVVPSDLPMMIGEPVASLIAPSVSTPSIDQKPLPCLLIVEDNHELREFLAVELSPFFQIMKAEDGLAGWDMTQAELPDIVITDVMMPRMDGYELTRRIKSHPDTDHIAVVMLTAKTAQPSRIEGLQQGADDYLSKPFSIDELRLRLHNLVTRQQKLSDHYRTQFDLPGESTAPECRTTADSPASQPVPRPAFSTDPFLLRLYGLLDQHLDDPSISVDWLADQLAMSRKTLYRKSQSLIQLPPADLIRQYRLRKAAELLRAGHNVAETANQTGFNTPSHFSTTFKEFYQKTPTAFITDRP